MTKVNYVDSPTKIVEGLAIPEHDYIAMAYTGANNAGADDPNTITYKTGGSGGTTVATLTLTYAATGRILTITKS
tara:strand:- start:3859 stop:4083 length:225 start_codon:yes stop_codon:yes gene_type:complete